MSDQITNVKIISDHIWKKQKVSHTAGLDSADQMQDYAYVDFASEEDMQVALKASTNVRQYVSVENAYADVRQTIRDTPVNVSISNPPSRGFLNEGLRGRGRGSFRGRGGSRGSFGGKKEGGGEVVGGSEKKESTSAAPSPAPAATASASGGDK